MNATNMNATNMNATGMNIGKSSRPKPGETECGDGYLVLENGNKVLIAVADGLGHGSGAAKASRAACRYIEEHGEDPLTDILEGCGKAIRGTRGVALTLLRILKDEQTLCYAGVGNVEMAAKTLNPIRPTNCPGIVGGRISRVKESRHPFNPGDFISVYTDGVSNSISLGELEALDAQTAADKIVEVFGQEHDDATCVVVKF